LNLRFYEIIFIVLCFIPFYLSAETIAPGMSGEELKNYLVENYKPEDTPGYDNARDILYGEIDLQDGDSAENEPQKSDKRLRLI